MDPLFGLTSGFEGRRQKDRVLSPHTHTTSPPIQLFNYSIHLTPTQSKLRVKLIDSIRPFISSECIIPALFLLPFLKGNLCEYLVHLHYLSCSESLPGRVWYCSIPTDRATKTTETLLATHVTVRCRVKNSNQKNLPTLLMFSPTWLVGDIAIRSSPDGSKKWVVECIGASLPKEIFPPFFL